MIGTTIGKYRIVGLLGRGATGIVYRAVDETLEREVAIKALNPHVAASDVMKRFRAEATTLAKLSHPEIATIHDLLRTDTDLLMVMELVRGETLEHLSTRVGPMSPQVAARLVDGILSALDHAHRAGIVHRDLKPANVMVTELGGIKIMDFGIARVRGAEHMTNDGCAIGTPAYMPPEQVLGEEIDGRADLYAVGVILYRLLTGTLPFEADAPIAMLQKQVAETPAPLHVHRQGLPGWCNEVVQRALAKAPADRFETAEEFRLALGRATGLVPSLDLAKALAVGADEVVSTRVESSAVAPVSVTTIDERTPETLAIDAAAAQDPRPAVTLTVEASERTARVAAPVPTPFILAKNFLQTRDGAAWVGGVAVAVVLVAYLASNAVAVHPGARARSDRGSANGTASNGDSPAVTESAARASGGAPRSSSSRAAAAAANDADSAASSAPLVFRTKILRAPDGRARDQEARLSLGEDSLTVAAYAAPDDPVFSARYADVTAIQHDREPAWKPPQKLSKVIRVEDDVLDAFGIRDRHHLSLYTTSDDEFIVLRVDERVVSKLLKALKQRTGRDPERDRRR